jgi:hypothetical protein
MIVSAPARRTIKMNTTVYSTFKGVDFSVDPALVDKSRSPYAPNLIADKGGMPEKRLGWRTLHQIEQPVNGLWHGEINGKKYYIAHGGTKLYKFTNDSIEVIRENVNNAVSNAFFMREYDDKGKLYILTGNEYLSYDGETVKNVADEAYIPTVLISRNPTGGGTLYEGVNLIGKKRKESFLGNDTATVYQLSANELDSVDKVEVSQEDGTNKTLTVETDYTVDLVSGKVTFKSAHKPIVEGQDNVFITYSKTVDDYEEKITKCTICDLYGLGGSNRVFLSGNPDYKAYDWHSDIFRPNYFPDLNYSIVGTADTAIMGYQKLGKYQVVIKEDNQQDSTVFQRWVELNFDGTASFLLEQGTAGIGAISKHCFGMLADEPLFLSRQGVQAITSNNITAERTIRNRSFFVDSYLTTEEGLENAVACEWNGFYVLCINGVAYVLDGKNKAYKERSIVSNDFNYECYYWTNMPAVCLLSVNGELFFGTADGRICKFNTDIELLDKYSDDGKAIVASWATKNDDDDAPHLYKNMIKKGCLITIKPYVRSSANVYVMKDGDPRQFLRSGTMDILDWDDIDFERFTFNTNDSPQDIFFKKKVKKYKRLQIIVENDALNEGFGILQIIKTFTVGNYAKK